MRTPVIHRIAITGVFISLVATTEAPAQTDSGATRVRVKFTPDQTIQGMVVASNDASISVDTGGAGIVQIDRDEILHVDRYEGQRRNWSYGLLVGAAAGMIVGGIVAATDEPEEDEMDFHMDGFVVAGYGLLGGAVGGAVGAFIKSDRWVSIPVSDVTIGIAPNHERGIAVTMSASF